MKNKILKEGFQTSEGYFVTKTGKNSYLIYIDPYLSESTYDIKDKIQPILKKYEAQYFGSLKVYGWFVSDKNFELVYNTKVRPCLKELAKYAKYPMSSEYNENDSDDIKLEKEYAEIDKTIDKLIAEFNIENFQKFETVNFNPTEVKNRLEEFKRELVSIVSGDEFKEKNDAYY